MTGNIYRTDADAVIIAEVFARKTQRTLLTSSATVVGGSGSMTMRKEERERLEKRGWAVGTAEDFLGLSAAETAYVELRLRLSESLRKRRLERSLSQNDLARLIRSSQSRVAKMEGADPTVSLDLLIRSLLALGASRRDLARAISPTQPERAS